MKIKYTLDKRTEIMEIMLTLTDYFDRIPKLRVPTEFDYAVDVKNYFSQYKNHRAVKLLTEIIHELSFNYDAPIALMWQLNSDFSINELLKYPFETRLGRSPKVLEFIKEIRNFTIDSKYDEFYKKHTRVYQKWIEDTKSKVDENLLDYMDNFYKEKLERDYIINLMPLQTHCNYAVENGDQSICNLGAKFSENKLEPYFLSQKNLDLIQHEFSHPLINPLTDKYFDARRMPPLPDEVKEKMRNLAYGSISTYVNEQIIRCTTILYLNNLYGEEYEETLIKQEEDIGFIHTRAVLQVLKEYEKQDVPLRKYFPKILEEFYKPLNNSLLLN